MPNRETPSRSSFGSVIIATILAGCAATNVSRTAEIHSQAKPCCDSIDSLPAATEGYFEQEIDLVPATPHYDFGLGLAPFVRLSLQPLAEKVFEIRAHPRASGKLLGGDGTFHYPDVKLVFFDTAGKVLPYSVPSQPAIKTIGFTGTYMLVSTVKAPQGTASVLVTTDARSLGQRGSSEVTTPAGGLMIGSTFIPMPRGQRSMGYTLSPYGGVSLLIFGAPSKKSSQ